MRVKRAGWIQRWARRAAAAAGWGALAFAAVWAAQSAHAAEPPGLQLAEDELEPAYAPVVRAHLDAAAESSSFVGLAVVIVDKGRISLLKTYGETQSRGGEAVGPETVFRLASVSKGFATTLVAQLAAEGRLDWSDRVVDHAPHFSLETASATRKVTLAHLASHQLGLPGHAYDHDLEAGQSMMRLLERTGEVDLICQPGTCHSYQNITFSLLGDVVEQATGKPLNDAARAQLFEPLGMSTASVGLAPLLNAESWARPHRLRGKRGARYWQTFTPDEAYYRVAAAGGFNASIYDLAQWLRANLGHAPDALGADELSELHEARVRTPNERAKWRWMRSRLRDADYALGWRVYDYAGEQLVFHRGGVDGYRAFAAMLPGHDFGVAAVWNSSTSRGWRILPAVLDAYLGLDQRDWLNVGQQVAAGGDPAARRGSP